MANNARLSASQQVQTACQGAAAATDTFVSLLDEAPSTNRSAAERAMLQLDMALSALRRASCEGLADMREKCRTFRRLEELLSPNDPRVQLVACDLVREMAEAITDTVEDAVSSDASRQVRRRSAVQMACQEAVAATDTFVGLLDEASAAERAMLQLDMALSALRRASCEGLADLREKCRTFRRLEELLSPSDPRVQLVACDLVREMAEAITDTVEDAVSSDASRQVRRRSGVQTACQEAVAATDTFVGLVAGPSAAERARLRLDMALSVFRCASCEGLADMREKCRTFRRLEELLSPSDPRLQLVACDLVREMTDLLEEQERPPDRIGRGCTGGPGLASRWGGFRSPSRRPDGDPGHLPAGSGEVHERARTTRQGDRA